MPFAFLFIGTIMLIAGVRGTSSELLTLFKGDITGNNNFGYWILSILVIGAVGYIPDFRAFSRAFLVLVIVVLILNEDKNGSSGFFASFQQAFQQISSSSDSTGNVGTVTTFPTNSEGQEVE